MGRCYRILGGTAAVLGAASLACALLTLLPGLLLPESRWLTVASGASAFLLFGAAVLWSLVSVGRPRDLWMPLRCLPGKVQAALGALVAGGAVLVLVDLPQGPGLQSPKAEYGSYYAFDKTAQEWVEIFSRAEYEALVELEERASHAGASLFLGIAAALFLSMGELRRR
ncbi:hypothetical protein [Streptomyces radiopugnans]|uniref:hypothetical protein n=1 Tax=Streptomyces radiopugnans TaxID=403935 RepID=UPI003F1D4939